jgi:hypothetical protein
MSDSKSFLDKLYREISDNKNIFVLLSVFLVVYFVLGSLLPRLYQWKDDRYRDLPSAIGPMAMEKFGGDFSAGYAAAQALIAGYNIYDNNQKHGDEFKDYFATENSRYIYPPLLAFIQSPLAFLSFESAYRTWLVFNLCLLIFSLYFLARLTETPWSAFVFLLIFYFSANFLYFYMERGQSDIISLFFITLSFYFYKKENRPLICALFFALAAMFKLYPALIGFYFLAKKEFRIIIYSTAWSLLIILLTGYRNWIETAHVLQRETAAWYKWIFTSTRLFPYYYQEHAFSTFITGFFPYKSTAYYILFAGIVLIPLLLLWWEIKKRGEYNILFVELSVLSILMVCIPTPTHGYNLVALGFSALSVFAMVRDYNLRYLGYLQSALLALLAAGPFFFIKTVFASNLYKYTLLSMLLTQLIFLFMCSYRFTPQPAPDKAGSPPSQAGDTPRLKPQSSASPGKAGRRNRRRKKSK